MPVRMICGSNWYLRRDKPTSSATGPNRCKKTARCPELFMRATPSSGPRRRPRSIAVDWHDCAWAPRIVVQFPAAARAHPRTTPVFLPLLPQGGEGVKPRGGHAPLRGRGEEADYSRSNPLAPALSPLGRGEGVGGNVKRCPRPSGRRQNGCLWPPGFCILFVSTRFFSNP